MSDFLAVKEKKYQKRNSTNNHLASDAINENVQTKSGRYHGAVTKTILGAYSDTSNGARAPDDDIDLSSEEKGFNNKAKSPPLIYSPSTLGTVRLPTAAELGYDMQFGTVLSDSSDSETESTGDSNYRYRRDLSAGRNDVASGSDVPSDEEEDDDDEEDVKRDAVNLVSRMNALYKLQSDVGMDIKNPSTIATRLCTKSIPMDDSEARSENDNQLSRTARTRQWAGTGAEGGKNDASDSDSSSSSSSSSSSVRAVEPLVMEKSDSSIADFFAPTLSERAPNLYSSLQTYISSRNQTAKKVYSAVSPAPMSNSGSEIPSYHGVVSEMSSQSQVQGTAQVQGDSLDLSADYCIGDLKVREILEIALQSVLQEHSIWPSQGGEKGGARPSLFSQSVLQGLCLSIGYHMGLDGDPASNVSSSLDAELRSFELCPVTAENCHLLIETAKAVVLRIDREMELGLGVFKSDKGRESASGDDGASQQENDDVDDGDIIESAESSDDCEDEEGDDRDEVFDLSYIHSNAPAWLIPKSPLDSVFRKSMGGVGQWNLEDVARSIQLDSDVMGGSQIMRAAEVDSILQDTDAAHLTLDDLPDHYGDRTDNAVCTDKPLYLDTRAADEARFNCMRGSSSPNTQHLASTFHSLAYRDDMHKEAGSGSGSRDSDDSINMDYLGDGKRSRARSVSFDATVSPEENDDVHDHLRSPRFSPPLSPPPHHLEDELPNGHSHPLSSAHTHTYTLPSAHTHSASSQSSLRAIQIATPDLWGDPFPPLPPSGELEKYQSQVRLRAQVERELLKRGNHVAFEPENIPQVEEYIEVGDEGIEYEDLPFEDGRHGDETWVGEGEDELENESSHIHPRSHPAHGPPPLRADGTLDLTRNVALNDQLTESLRDVLKSYAANSGATASRHSTVAVMGGTLNASDSDRRKGLGESVRSTVLREYEALSRGAGTYEEVEAQGEAEEEESEMGFRAEIYSQYDLYTQQDQGRDTTYNSSPTVWGAAHGDGTPSKSKGLHVHIKDIEKEDIPHPTVLTNTIDSKKFKQNDKISDASEVLKKKKSTSSNGEKGKSRGKKKGVKEGVEELEPRSLHTPKYITEKYSEVRGSQDYRTGIYRSGSRSLPSSPTPSNAYKLKKMPSGGTFSASSSPSRESIKQSRTGSAAGIGAGSGVGSGAQLRASQHPKAKDAKGVKSPPPKSALKRGGVSERELRGSLSVRIPSASASSSSSPYNPLQDSERVADKMQEKEIGQDKRHEVRDPDPLSSYDAGDEVPAWLTPESPMHTVFRRSLGFAGKPEMREVARQGRLYHTGRDVRASPYSSAKVSRSGSPIVRRSSGSGSSQSGGYDVYDQERDEEMLQEISEDWDGEERMGAYGVFPRSGPPSFSSQGTPLSSRSTPSIGKDPRLRPRSAKGRSRSNDGHSPSSPTRGGSGGEFSPENAEGEEGGWGEREIGSRESTPIDRVRPSPSYRPATVAPNASSYSPTLNTKKSPHSEQDYPLDYSHQHFSRDTVFSQSLREAIRQSVEGSFRQFLGPLLRQAVKGKKKKQSSSASSAGPPIGTEEERDGIHGTGSANSIQSRIRKLRNILEAEGSPVLSGLSGGAPQQPRKRSSTPLRDDNRVPSSGTKKQNPINRPQIPSRHRTSVSMGTDRIHLGASVPVPVPKKSTKFPLKSPTRTSNKSPTRTSNKSPTRTSNKSPARSEVRNLPPKTGINTTAKAINPTANAKSTGKMKKKKTKSTSSA